MRSRPPAWGVFGEAKARASRARLRKRLLAEVVVYGDPFRDRVRRDPVLFTVLGLLSGLPDAKESRGFARWWTRIALARGKARLGGGALIEALGIARRQVVSETAKPERFHKRQLAFVGVDWGRGDHQVVGVTLDGRRFDFPVDRGPPGE